MYPYKDILLYAFITYNQINNSLMSSNIQHIFTFSELIVSELCFVASLFKPGSAKDYMFHMFVLSLKYLLMCSSFLLTLPFLKTSASCKEWDSSLTCSLIFWFLVTGCLFSCLTCSSLPGICYKLVQKK